MQGASFQLDRFSTYTSGDDRRRRRDSDEREGTTGSSEGHRSARLPPRSREGCWTCRTRKVKCDERRPVCGACARLRRACDYHDRYDFRDDTSKQRNRSDEVSETSCPVWDSSARSRRRPRPASLYEDVTPFAALPDEEARERRAALGRPGMYYVIANQQSFASLPEYGAALESGGSSARTRPMYSPVQESPTVSNPEAVFIERFDTSPHQRPVLQTPMQSHEALAQRHSPPTDASTHAVPASESRMHATSEAGHYDRPSATSAYEMPYQTYGQWAGAQLTTSNPTYYQAPSQAGTLQHYLQYPTAGYQYQHQVGPPITYVQLPYRGYPYGVPPPNAPQYGPLQRTPTSDRPVEYGVRAPGDDGRPQPGGQRDTRPGRPSERHPHPYRRPDPD